MEVRKKIAELKHRRKMEIYHSAGYSFPIIISTFLPESLSLSYASLSLRFSSPFLSYFLLFFLLPCFTPNEYVMWNEVVSHHIISYYTISYHTISYHIMIYHIISSSNHIISYHIIPYHIISSSYHII